MPIFTVSWQCQQVRKGGAFRMKAYRATLLLFFDDVPLRVLSEVLCRRPRSEDPERTTRPSMLPTAGGLRRLVSTSSKNRISRNSLGFLLWPSPHVALCSTSVSFSYLKTANSNQPHQLTKRFEGPCACPLCTENGILGIEGGSSPLTMYRFSYD